MKLLKKLKKNTAVALSKLFKGIYKNKAELYLGLVLFIALPLSVGLLTSFEWGLLTSFTLQAVVGILYLMKGGK